MAQSQAQNPRELPAGVTRGEGSGELPCFEIETEWSSAEIYLHGAHITHFQNKGGSPILFMSQCSRFEEGIPIRGGIPVIFPWFGGRAGFPAHGFARTENWSLDEAKKLATGEVTLQLSLPESKAGAEFPKFSAKYLVTVGKTLQAELIVTNLSPAQPFVFENCLHSYFTIGDIGSVFVTGLKGVDYLDKTANLARKTEQSGRIQVSGEVDRTYLDTMAAVEIHDAAMHRRICVGKSGSRSTVVWNPWVDKSIQMSDFGDEEYHKMICVESGNVADNRITLPPGQSTALKIEISARPL